jgi:hypothetical protein
MSGKYSIELTALKRELVSIMAETVRKNVDSIKETKHIQLLSSGHMEAKQVKFRETAVVRRETAHYDESKKHLPFLFLPPLQCSFLFGMHWKQVAFNLCHSHI